MDTALGVVFEDFVIIAADKAENMSILRLSEDSSKIHRLTSNTVMAIVGEPGDTDQFSRYVQCNFELEKFRDDGWEVSLTRAYHWITWQLAQDIRSNRPYAVFPLLGGYDIAEKRCRLFWCDYLGTGAEVTYGAHGYGESFATGFLDRYHRANLPREQAIELVKGALDAIQTRLIVGQNVFQMVIVDKDGIHALPDHMVDRSKVMLKFLSANKHFSNLTLPEHSVKPIEFSYKSGQKLMVKPLIGLEVHAQLNTISKLFSRGSSASQNAPNTQLDLLDISIPGALPTLNGAAVRAAILTGLGLNCTIQDVIHFDRKNYFYTDMPAGFQITQYYKPIAKNGYIDFIVTPHHRSLIAHSQQYDITKYLYNDNRVYQEEQKPYIKRSHIKQLQLEQDSAKTLCQVSSDHSNSVAEEINHLVDYNRCGAGLMEIVFEPDLESPREAASLVKELIKILRALNTCDCELQEGSLRVDANVSIKSIDGQEIPEQDAGRVELKNLNSLKSLAKGLAYEIERQAVDLASGKGLNQESRTYDTKTGRTVLLRAKESAVDYRYVPEPSIPPLRIEQSLVDSARSQLDQLDLPAMLRDILTRKYGLDLVLTAELLDEPGLTEYFIDIIDSDEFKYDVNVLADFLIYSVANLKGINLLPFKVDLLDKESEFLKRLSPHKMRDIFGMLMNDKISFAIAYEIMKIIFTSGAQEEPRKLVEQMGWFQVTDEQEVESRCKEIISGMKNVSKQYRKKGQKRHLRMMLDKLCELHNNRISIKQAIECFDKLLRKSDQVVS